MRALYAGTVSPTLIVSKWPPDILQ